MTVPPDDNAFVMIPWWVLSEPPRLGARRAPRPGAVTVRARFRSDGGRASNGYELTTRPSS